MTDLQKNVRLNRLVLGISLTGWGCCLVLASERLRGLLINSTLLAGGALLISVPAGTVLAVVIAKTSLGGRRALERLLIVMLFIPLFVQATAWQASVGQGGWLGNQGWLSGWTGAIWIHGVAAIPWVVLFVAATLRKVPRELEEEALQDAAAWRVLFRISLRHAVAGIFAAALWIAVICFSEITVTDLFQVRTFAEEIYTAASLGTLDKLAVGPAIPTINQVDVPQFVANELLVGTLSVILLVASALAAIWIWVPVTDFVSPASDWTWRLRNGRWVLTLGIWLLTAAVVGTPLLGLLGKAGAQVTPTEDGAVHSWSVMKAATLIGSSPWQHRREFGWSLAIGAVASIAAIATATLIAWALRTKRLPAWPTALALSITFALPGPLLGVWIIRLLNHSPESLFAPLTWLYDHTIFAPTLAQFLRALPLATLILSAQFTSMPQDILDSAKSEGAGWWRRLFSVALPWGWSAVLAAACMSLIISLGDLAATLLVVPPGVSPLSVRIFGLLHYGAEDQVSALCLMLVMLFSVAVTVAWRVPAWLNRDL